MELVKYFKALRIPFIQASALNFILFWLSFTTDLNQFFFLGLTGIIFAHLAGNLWNDYFDFDSDSHNRHPTLFSGGSRFLQTKQILPQNFFGWALVISFLALGTGLAILILLPKNQLPLIILIMVSSFLTLFYTAPPFKFVYRKAGEFVIILTFGPLIMVGISYIQGMDVKLNQLLLSVLFGLFVARILFINQILDYEPDKQSGKRTLANLFPKDCVRYFIWIFSLPAILILISISSGLLLYLSLSVLILSEILFLLVNKPLFWAALGLISHFLTASLWIVFFLFQIQ